MPGVSVCDRYLRQTESNFASWTHDIMMHTMPPRSDARNAWLTSQHASRVCKCPIRSPKCRPGAGFSYPPHRFYVCKEWHHATVPLKGEELVQTNYSQEHNTQSGNARTVCGAMGRLF